MPDPTPQQMMDAVRAQRIEAMDAEAMLRAKLAATEQALAEARAKLADMGEGGAE